jgi:hyaluronoglucosaminidase
MSVYWNIPTFMCHQYGFNFTEAVTRFNIVQNKGDQFRGEKFSILYEPGLFPSLSRLANGSFHFRNGGVPQEGSLFEHIGAFKRDVDLLVPDVHNNGNAIFRFPRIFTQAGTFYFQVSSSLTLKCGAPSSAKTLAR